MVTRLDDDTRPYLGFEPLSLGEGAPLFRRVDEERVLYYAPGKLAWVRPGDRLAFEAQLWPGGAPPVSAAARAVLESARQALACWEDFVTAPFEPVCLTLYLNNSCNLACGYCYSHPVPHLGANAREALGDWDPQILRQAIEMVAQNCQAQARPFILVFHGGGEPRLSRRRMEEILALTREIADTYRIPVFRYIATNGVMPTGAAKWLAQTFSLVGVSCDGPADIQAAQRPLNNGAGSTRFVERTVDILREEGVLYHVRATLTPQTVYRQVEIAEYLCRRLQPSEIHVEPVYPAGLALTRTAGEMGAGAHASPGPPAGFTGAESADIFISAFMQARRVAQGYGVVWMTSGSRLSEVHGPYCNVYRSVLNLVPGGVATACFKTPDAEATRAAGFAIGDIRGPYFEIDQARIASLKQGMARPAPRCAACFNQYHCVRSCPEACWLLPQPGPAPIPAADFRCRLQMGLAGAYLQQALADPAQAVVDSLGATYVTIMA